MNIDYFFPESLVFGILLLVFTSLESSE